MTRRNRIGPTRRVGAEPVAASASGRRRSWTPWHPPAGRRAPGHRPTPLVSGRMRQASKPKACGGSRREGRGNVYRTTCDRCVRRSAQCAQASTTPVARPPPHRAAALATAPPRNIRPVSLCGWCGPPAASSSSHPISSCTPNGRASVACSSSG
eukprot:7361289-Prymnesium_polylepis.1